MSPKTPTSGEFASIKIIGSGLIGTSIGLALANKGVSVEMADIDPKAAKLANDLVACAAVASPEIILYAGPSSGLKSCLESEFKMNKHLKFTVKNSRCWTPDIASRRWTSMYKSFKEAMRLESKGFSKAGITLSEITLPHTRSPSHTLPHSLPRTFRQTQTRCLKSRN